MEFHVSRKARDRYQFEDALFSLSGNVIFANFHASRVFAQKMNTRRNLVSFPEQVIRSGQLNAMGLIDEILHLVVNLYREQKKPDVMRDALTWVYGLLGADVVDETLRAFAAEFPPLSVYRREMSIEDYLEGDSEISPGVRVSNRQVLLEEMLLLWLANVNPAFSPFMELFDDTTLEKETAYLQVIHSLHTFFESQPPFGPDNHNLVDMLRSPAIAVPHSLSGQLEYIRQRWGFLLGKYLYRLLSSLDLIREEEKAIFLGPGPSRVYEFTGMELEPERFSPDRDWMPSLVLIAKNAYVWLDQLSKKYRRSIVTLDQIPDEELDKLSRWGFSGLWLIGLWERSAASKRIKQLRGNPEAVASAYSLFDYQIAADLGGDASYENLRERAWRYHIRLASDMVPNHMGIDSRWVIEHPDWFISLDYSPFPSYSFNGPDLSWDNRVGIYIEDHYYNNSDAAVVFKRVDRWSGSQKFIYHGNDGTSMPWNDTAQLDYLKAEVREAVIQTILQVARKFPVIRFDAAMTLAKKHYQRLWFPEPGSGGAIPSRAEHGLTKEQFDAAFPVEFWREVVDRVAQEVPDTLLLAEAFWLMEGYFVRTLGMHRVYNSAFMNMLRDEKNAEYRLVIKNTLEFDPEILKRYVNFMNNPDERTAIDQFGKGDKYFGICTLMSTLPGLPMFGHGQIEGFTEKYGMEYRRAYWEESPDPYLVERHEREIFPLLRKRYLFA
ncbi:MAG: alpha-amylase family glycosyl hydrolase, partial [Omnitrophica WOR_2 bacterium]